jgi:outer membrane protein TolC
VREVEAALVNLESARSRSDDARTAAEGYRASFTGTEARYRGGLGSLFELEDARRTLFAAETALVGLQRERAAAWIALYRALGGGWARPSGDSSMAAPVASTPASEAAPTTSPPTAPTTAQLRTTPSKNEPR